MSDARRADRLWVRAAIPLTSLGLVLAVWLALVHLLGVAPYVLPSPGHALHAIHADWDVLGPGLLLTGKEFVLGFVLGTGAGFLLAVAMAQSRWVQRFLYPILIASQAIPIIAIGAALVIWLGFGLTPKIVIVALIVFFPVLVNVLDALATVDRDTVNLARAMGASSWRIFRVVRLPATYSPMFSALKMSATFSVTGAVIGEQTASNTGGLGVYLTEQQSRLNTPAVFGDILLLAAMGILAFTVVVAWETLATPWRRLSIAPRRRRYAHGLPRAARADSPDPADGPAAAAGPMTSPTGQPSGEATLAELPPRLVDADIHRP